MPDLAGLPNLERLLPDSGIEGVMISLAAASATSISLNQRWRMEHPAGLSSLFAG